jgi:hypothetical protein
MDSHQLKLFVRKSQKRKRNRSIHLAFPLEEAPEAESGIFANGFVALQFMSGTSANGL